MNLRLLKAQDIAKALSVSPSTVYQWAELGQIPCLKVNGALRFDPDDFISWVQSCKKAANSSYNPLIQARGPRKGGR
jgi:predicted DNA-binding transcriptional regulator AlpA